MSEFRRDLKSIHTSHRQPRATRVAQPVPVNALDASQCCRPFDPLLRIVKTVTREPIDEDKIFWPLAFTQSFQFGPEDLLFHCDVAPRPRLRRIDVNDPVLKIVSNAVL